MDLWICGGVVVCNAVPISVQDAAPTLDRDGGVHKYSRAFQEVVGKCLAKDPAGR